MNWRNHTRMFTPERIGLLTLCILFAVMLIALLLSQRDCSGADTRAAATVVIDSIAPQDTAKVDTVQKPPKEKKWDYRRYKIRPIRRNHLDEDIVR